MACAHPESVSTGLGRVAAFAACQIDQVDPAGDTVVMFLAFHKLSLHTQTQMDSQALNVSTIHPLPRANVFFYIKTQRGKRGVNTQ